VSASEAVTHQAAIAQAQEGLLASLSAHPLARVKRFHHLPYLALTVNEAALETLMGDPTVARIFKDEMYLPTLAQSVPLIHAASAHTAGWTGKGWTVAILDTGVDTTHPFLTGGKVVSEACYSTTDAGQAVFSLCPNGQMEQVGTGAGVNCSPQIEGCEHGTHVAGIAAGNAAGTITPNYNGVATGANILAIQVFSEVNDASECRHTPPCAKASTSDILKGLERVYELRTSFPIAAVNLSLGGSEKFTSACDAQSPLTATIQQLRAANIATVVASGNGGFTDGLSHPACVSAAISVGNTTKSDAVSPSSNSASFLSLLAPGTAIVSSLPGSQLGPLTGTSMAAPHVAGTFALLRQAQPSASVSEMLAALQKTGVPIRDPRNGLTTPRIDVQAALDVLRGLRNSGMASLAVPER
jgi:subtilisin family serine protease